MAPKSPAERAREYRKRKADNPGHIAKNKAKCSAFHSKLSDSVRDKCRNAQEFRARSYREKAITAVLQAIQIEDEVTQPDPTSSQASTSTSTSTPSTPQSSQSVPVSPFASRQMFGKALKKSKASLPKSPRKSIAIVEKLAAQVGLQVVSPTAKRLHFGVRDEIRSAIVKFFLRDDISRQLPGKKDVISVKRDGVKVKVAKRLLMFNLKETHQAYLKEHEGLGSVGISTFCNLRPKEVSLVSSKSQTVCCCPYCENIQLLFKSVQWSRTYNYNPKNVRELVSMVVCDQECSKCMKRDCKQCPTDATICETLNTAIDDDRESILVNQWKKGKLDSESFTR